MIKKTQNIRKSITVDDKWNKMIQKQQQKLAKFRKQSIKSKQLKDKRNWEIYRASEIKIHKNMILKSQKNPSTKRKFAMNFIARE